MAEFDRMTARALVEAGYMPLSHYVELFGHDHTGRGVDLSIIPTVCPTVCDDEFEPAQSVRHH